MDGNIGPLRDDSEDSAARSLYIEANEAADLLGITVNSLYSYVSRKGIRTKAVTGSRRRLYWREDIEKLIKHSVLVEEPSANSVLVRETKITVITREGPFYRGHSVIKLAETATLEQVAALLWEVKEEDVFTSNMPPVPEKFDEIREALKSLSLFDQAASLLPLLESFNSRAYDFSPLGFARTGAYLLRWLTALLIGAHRPSEEPTHVVLARGLGAPEGYEDIIRRALVLLADHELAPPTYAVRAVANTGCSPARAIVTGFAAANGRRVLTGRLPAVRRLIDEILDEDAPEVAITERFREGEAIPGFADAVYRGEDARARALLSAMSEQFGSDEGMARLSRAVAFARSEYGLEADMMIPLAYLERTLRPRSRDLAISPLGRVVGYIAHAIEQMSSGPIVRPRAIYTGQLPVETS